MAYDAKRAAVSNSTATIITPTVWVVVNLLTRSRGAQLTPAWLADSLARRWGPRLSRVRLADSPTRSRGPQVPPAWLVLVSPKL